MTVVTVVTVVTVTTVVTVITVVTVVQNSNCGKNHYFKLGQDSKTQIVTKLKNLNGDKT